MELTKNLTQGKLIKSLVVVIIGSIALTISAKIKIPFYPVPMTMQTFVVLFLGISLGHKIALAAIGLYLIEGIAHTQHGNSHVFCTHLLNPHLPSRGRGA